jgi:hypothetical protein
MLVETIEALIRLSFSGAVDNFALVDAWCWFIPLDHQKDIVFGFHHNLTHGRTNKLHTTTKPGTQYGHYGPRGNQQE